MDKLFVIYKNGQKVNTNSNAYLKRSTARAGITHLCKQTGNSRQVYNIKEFVKKEDISIVSVIRGWFNG